MSGGEESHVPVVRLKSHPPPDLDPTDATREHRVRQESAPAWNRIWAVPNRNWAVITVLNAQTGPARQHPQTTDAFIGSSRTSSTYPIHA
jgi:hypothetical protein